MENSYMEMIIRRLKYLGLYSIKDYDYIVDIFNWLTKNDDIHVDLTKYVTSQQLDDFTAQLNSKSTDDYNSIVSAQNSSAPYIESKINTLDSVTAQYGSSSLLPVYINVSKLSSKYVISENNALTVITNGSITNGSRNFVIILDARGAVVTYGITNVILRG